MKKYKKQEKKKREKALVNTGNGELHFVLVCCRFTTSHKQNVSFELERKRHIILKIDNQFLADKSSP